MEEDILELFQKSKKYEKLFIFGAQHFAHTMYLALSMVIEDFKPESFLVSDKERNPEEVEGILVKQIDDIFEKKDKSLVIIAVSKKKYLDEITVALKKNGFHNFYPLLFSGKEDNALRRIYFKKLFDDQSKKFIFAAKKEQQENDLISKGVLELFMVKSHFDNQIGASVTEKEWITEIQAGSELTDKVLAEVRDNIGEHISYKNRNYCECTAIYCILKNRLSTDRYIGISHYRRRLHLTHEVQLSILQGDVDVILPMPVITIKGEYDIHYRPYIKESDFQCLLSIIEKCEPDYYSTAAKVIEGNLFYPCNMFIASNSIFYHFTEWLFRILFLVEKECGDETIRQDRYLGYLAEHLTTIYFTHWYDNWKIIHCNMEIMY